jgi:type I restriction enzyme S subunit
MELNDAGIWGSGGTPSRKNPRYYENGTIPWLVIGDLNDQAVEEFSTSITELGLINSSAKLIPTGSLLVAMYGSIGKLGITTFPCTTNQAIAFCIPNEELVELRYLFHALANAKPELIAKGQGGAQQNISQGILKEHLIPLSPLNEQRRIAAKLGTTLAAVEACRQRLDGVAAILKRFRQAVLAAATSGELTREWREERGLSTDSWSQATIFDISDQIFDGPFGSNLKSEDYTPEGFRVVRLENISHLQFLEEKCTFVSLEKFALLQKHVLFENDILFSSFVDEEVRTCLLPSALSGMSINKADCFCVRVNRNLSLPGFVVSVLSCRSIFKSLDGLVHGATRPRINLKQLKTLSIALPSLQEQFEILRRQEQLFTLADQLEARLTAARKVVDRLAPALLAKAFRGELVPQDPNDEPASFLLERIRAARQAEAGAGKPSRRGRPKAAANPDQLPPGAALVPPDFLAGLLRECGPLSERALLAVSELEPKRFQQQLYRELESGTAREVQDNGQVLLEAVG